MSPLFFFFLSVERVLVRRNVFLGKDSKSPFGSLFSSHFVDQGNLITCHMYMYVCGAVEYWTIINLDFRVIRFVSIENRCSFVLRGWV